MNYRAPKKKTEREELLDLIKTHGRALVQMAALLAFCGSFVLVLLMLH